MKKGKRLTKADMLPGTTAFMAAMDWNNGLRQRIAPAPLHPAGVLTVNCNGNGVAEAFYQPEPFFASDDLNVLYRCRTAYPTWSPCAHTPIRCGSHRSWTGYRHRNRNQLTLWSEALGREGTH